MTAPLRIVLDEQKFRRLVAGEAITVRGGVEIVVALTWRKMIDAVLDGVPKRAPADPPEAREFLPLRRRGSK